MDVTPLISSDRQVIQSYRGGVFKISNVSYDGAVFVLPDRVIRWDFPKIESPTEAEGSRDPSTTFGITIEDFAPLKPFVDQIEVLLLGTGAKQIMLTSALRNALKKAYGFTVEAMDTGAACRTYNVLMAEGRRIAAALI